MRGVATAVACVLLVAACGGGGSGAGTTSQTPKSGGTATIALESELRTLDPMDSSLLVEHLTERELIVLHYLPTMLKAGEIAADLYVSVNTVKAHLRSMYRKLGVSNRREAVERARSQGLL